MSSTNLLNNITATIGGGGSSGSNGGGGPCGACKFLRRKCAVGCIFAPYFDSEQGATHFASVHRVFGASNVSKLLLHVPVDKRLDAVVTICFEAQSRLRDPIHGCVSHIFALQQQVMSLQAELSYLQAHLAAMELPSPPPPPPPQPQPFFIPQSVTMSGMPIVPSTYDLSSHFDNPAVHPSWTLQQRQPQMDPRQFSATITNATRSSPNMECPSTAGGEDIQELARTLLN